MSDLGYLVDDRGFGEALSVRAARRSEAIALNILVYQNNRGSNELLNSVIKIRPADTSLIWWTIEDLNL